MEIFKDKSYNWYLPIEYDNMIKEIERLKEIAKEHKNCTRKHWQQKCAEHCANEMLYKSRIDEAVDFIKEKISSTQGVINDYMYHKEHNECLIELLKEDIEMYKKELNILQGNNN